MHVEYTQGPIDFGLGYQTDGESLVSDKKSIGGGLVVKFSALTLFSTYVRTSDVNATDTGKNYVATLGVRVPMGPGELRASARKTDSGGDRNVERQRKFIEGGGMFGQRPRLQYLVCDG